MHELRSDKGRDFRDDGEIRGSVSRRDFRRFEMGEVVAGQGGGLEQIWLLGF